MALRVVAFVRGVWRQRWHCWRLAHQPYTQHDLARRIDFLACLDCGETFWRRW